MKQNIQKQVGWERQKKRVLLIQRASVWGKRNTSLVLRYGGGGVNKKKHKIKTIGYNTRNIEYMNQNKKVVSIGSGGVIGLLILDH